MRKQYKSQFFSFQTKIYYLNFFFLFVFLSGPVLDAVATLLRGPIRSAIANRRSEFLKRSDDPVGGFNKIKATRRVTLPKVARERGQEPNFIPVGNQRYLRTATITPPTVIQSPVRLPPPPTMGVGLGGSGHTTATMDSSQVAATVPTIKEESAETSADSLTIDVEGHEEDSDQTVNVAVHGLKSEIDPVQGKAWVHAIRTHVVVPLIR